MGPGIAILWRVSCCIDSEVLQTQTQAKNSSANCDPHLYASAGSEKVAIGAYVGPWVAASWTSG